MKKTKTAIIPHKKSTILKDDNHLGTENYKVAEKSPQKRFTFSFPYSVGVFSEAAKRLKIKNSEFELTDDNIISANMVFVSKADQSFAI